MRGLVSSADRLRGRPVVSILILAMAMVSAAATGTSCGDGAEEAISPEDREKGEDTLDLLEKKAAPEKTMAEMEADGLAMKPKADAPGDEGRGGEAETWKRSKVSANTARLMIGDEEELPLSGMQVNVKVDGFRARVLLDLFFFNDRDSSYEGTFKLRLPNEASPFYFAFGESTYKGKAPGASERDPHFFDEEAVRGIGFAHDRVATDRGDQWTNVKEARMVPKEKAALAYTETVRRSVDPALMEWAGAGVFSARVFPLTSGKLHRIVIGYDVELLQVGDDLVYRIDLPVGMPKRIVDVNVAELGKTPIVTSPATKGAVVGGRRHFRFERRDDPTITVRYKKPGTILLAGTDAGTGRYLATRFKPKLPAGGAAGGASHAVFLVDTSLSANPEGFNVWLKLLRAILDNNRGSLKHFAVLFFNVEAFWWNGGAFVGNTPENVTELMAFAENLALEGATDLGLAISTAALAARVMERRSSPGGIDFFLLSDAAATWGESDLHAVAKPLVTLKGRGSLFAYTTGLTGTDTGALSHLARESGGAVFAVVGAAEVDAASRAHRSRPWRIEGFGVTSAAGSGDMMLAGHPRTAFPGQTLLLTGRGAAGAGTTVVLDVSRDAKKLKLAVRPDHVLESDLAPRIYGQIATGMLEELGDTTEAYSRAYGCHFRVTGRTCSLLMLDTDEDYARFDIKPEEHAFVIKGNPATEVVARVLKEIGDLLTDPKRGFLAWLKRLEKMPGFGFEIPTALAMAVEKMPPASFTVTPKPLSCKARKADDVPGGLRDSLAGRELDYDILTAEAERRLGKHGPADALKALSSLVENNPGDTVLARDVGFSAMEWGLGAQAYYLFRRVAIARPHEPQNYHAMAKILEASGKIDLAIAYYEVGLAGNWDSRFGEFRKILGMDYVRLLRRVAARELRTSVPDFATTRLETVTKELGLGTPDLVVTITWNTDGTDIDLHVVEPTGEECYYDHARTKIGGSITEDVVSGYGPEMYVLPKAPSGSYAVRAKYFASDRNRASARTKVYATIYERWGTPGERVTRKVVTLAEGKDMHDIATIELAR